MSTSQSHLTFSLAALATVALAVCAVANSAFPSVEKRHETTANSVVVIHQAQSLTLDQAVAMVEAKYKARAIRYNSVESDGRSIHYIRLITADRTRVFTVRVDASTGQELPE